MINAPVEFGFDKDVFEWDKKGGGARGNAESYPLFSPADSKGEKNDFEKNLTFSFFICLDSVCDLRRRLSLWESINYFSKRWITRSILSLVSLECALNLNDAPINPLALHVVTNITSPRNEPI